MKVLCFIDKDKINSFFAKIKSKYENVNTKFFSYFNKTYLLNAPFNDKN